MITIGVTGAVGRMGRRIIALAEEAGDLQVVAALEVAGHELLGQDAGLTAGVKKLNVAISEQPQVKPDVMIDFSLPASTEKWIDYCGENGIAMVIGTTGLSEAHQEKMRQAGHKTAVLWGANMSLGVNLLFKLVAEVAASLPDDYDMEIVEAHHRFKRDAPSGTALELARKMAQARGWPWPACLVHGREGKDALRQEKTIGMHAVRGGDIVGEHSVMFSALGETVSLGHRAHSRDTFVRGALQAARWLKGKQPGLYSMFDVLGL
ncbi:MAG: 4-hydroxy-tetrahydrodipicolinate reductase [Sedimentisphaerales bacterium]|nr:4-hydroxy-tetrahydrodipicolinate reductase [Sedimentisphaerales bacterium]